MLNKAEPFRSRFVFPGSVEVEESKIKSTFSCIAVGLDLIHAKLTSSGEPHLIVEQRYPQHNLHPHHKIGRFGNIRDGSLEVEFKARDNEPFGILEFINHNLITAIILSDNARSQDKKWIFISSFENLNLDDWENIL